MWGFYGFAEEFHFSYRFKWSSAATSQYFNLVIYLLKEVFEAQIELSSMWMWMI